MFFFVFPHSFFVVGAVGVSSFFFSSPFFVRYTGEGGYLRGPSKGGEGIAIITPKKERTPKKTTTKLKTLAGGLRVFFFGVLFLAFLSPFKKNVVKEVDKPGSFPPCTQRRVLAFSYSIGEIDLLIVHGRAS